MLKTFSSLFASGMRAFKVQDVDRKTRVGITAKNLNEVLQKGKQKLKIAKNEEVTVVTEDDGTLVDCDDFLHTLSAHSVLVFLREGESWSGAGELIYQALNRLYNTDKKMEIAEQIRELMTDETGPEKISIMSQYLEMLETDVEAEERYEHEDWFDGVNKKYKTKGEVLRNSAQQRIRSYYTSAKDQIEKERDPKTKALLSELLEQMYTKLKKNDFHGHYFDRSGPGKARMCDKQGWFKCEGAFDEDSCPRLHTINPYASRGYRQMFGLWNLDHIIEKSREVIPTLVSAAKNRPRLSELNSEEVYKLLFTRENLRLVQVACHKKAARADKTVSMETFFVS